MVVLGLVLLVGAVALTAAMVTSNTGAVEIDLWGLSLSSVSMAAAFAAGMVTAAVGLAGVVLLLGGTRRSSKLRRERRALARENERLTRRIETAHTEPVPVSPGARAGTAPAGAPPDALPPPESRGSVPRRWRRRRDATDATEETADGTTRGGTRQGRHAQHTP